VQITLSELAALVGGQFSAPEPHPVITGVGSVSDAGPGDITFFSNSRYLGALKTSAAAAAFVPLDFTESIRPIPVRVENPSVAFAVAASRFAPPPVVFEKGIHPSAVISPDAQIGTGVSIGPCVVIEPGASVGDRTVIGAGSYIGHEARIGQDTLLYPNVVVRERCLLGDRVIIHSGTVIGSDGFGFEVVNGRHKKIPQTGIVQIDNDVEVGANVTIDRARFGKTWIQEGAKLDNLVQIAHNVVIGKHALIVAQVGISGSSTVGDYAILAGQVGVAGHLRIGAQAIVGAQSGVTKDVPAGEKWFGYPAAPMKEMKERLAYLSRLARLAGQVKDLEARLSALENGATPPADETKQ
jgi:UDP-3-O-[3-hydroxymyristoyl] glucosamine N-acyltransferase